MTCKPVQKRVLLKLARLLLAIWLAGSSFQRVLPPDIAKACRQLDQADEWMENHRLEAAVPLLLTALDFFEQTGDTDDAYEACHQLDLCFARLNQPDEGIAFLQKPLSHQPLSDSTKAFLLVLLADNYYVQGSYQRAIENYEIALQIAEQKQITELLLRCFGNLGWLYWDAGDHTKALEYQKKSLQLAIEREDKKNIPILLRDIGDTYRAMGDRQSLTYFQRSLSLAPKNVETLIQCSKAFQQFKMPDSAMLVLKTAMPLLQDKAEKADACYQYARLLKEVKKLPQAQIYIEKALKYCLASYGKAHAEYGRFTHLAGNISLASGNAEQALYWFDQTLQQKHPQKSSTALELSHLAPGSYWVLGSLQGRAKAFYLQYLHARKTIHLHQALNAFELAMAYGEKMRLSHSHESSKLELYEYLHPIVEGVVQTALQLAETTGDNTFLEKAYLFAERAKAPVMAEALYDKEIKHVAGIPDSLLEHEKELTSAIGELEIAVNNEPDNDSLRNALLNGQIVLESLKDQLKNNFPHYFDLKYAFSKQVDLQQIREHLPEGTLLVQYLMGDAALYTFAVSKHELQVYTLPLNDSLYATLAAFRRSISDWAYIQSATEQAERDFLATAPLLYQRLLARPLTEFKVRKLIIVPDGYLGLIPFEALLTRPFSGPWKGRDMPYLLRDYPISYAWSASAIMPVKAPANKPRYNFVGIGTQYDADTVVHSQLFAMRDLGPLPNADDEVRAIGALMQGKTWLNAAATKEHFMAAAPECGILHIATHGLLDEDKPMLSSLVFNSTPDGSSNQLYALELYNLQLQARMTVLSACNTGKGKVHNGEGVMSLARAFAFAGCPTTVSSLWSVNDLSTANIMEGFYRLLQSGTPVDESMQAAKIQYLDAATAQHSKPVYWASFVVIGNSEPLPASLFNTGYFSMFWGGIALLALALLYLVFRKYKIPNRPIK